MEEAEDIIHIHEFQFFILSFNVNLNNEMKTFPEVDSTVSLVLDRQWITTMPSEKLSESGSLSSSFLCVLIHKVSFTSHHFAICFFLCASQLKKEKQPAVCAAFVNEN